MNPPFTVKLFYSKGNPNNGTLHILTKVETVFVCKRWCRRYLGWRYFCEDELWLDDKFEQGIAKVIKSRITRGGK